MADKTVEMILKAAEGNFHVVAVLDKDGNDITATYAKKTELGSFRAYRDEEGYPCYDETTQGGE